MALEIIEKEDIVLVCNHVLNKTKDAEYHKNDDSYVCSNCRDIHAECKRRCKKQCLQNLAMVHRECLGV